MAKKAKRLCKWSGGDIKKNLAKFSAIVEGPKYVCTKCGRVANDKKWLHDTSALKS
jgi:hypothetical protein